MVSAMNIFSNPGTPFSQFSYPGLEFHSDHFLDLFHGSSEFKSSPTDLPPASWDSLQCCVQFELLVSFVCSAQLALVL